ncbi:uncharacterized protein A4U43_C05F15270 [Asparagus officinalis]|uniref:Uncharacterized protein n=1 Tax=Asparagus officinalis TaxID=4686 RepID=A0A5P1EUA7_ASPOF|nr:uncharacterized protein A4U43_C05F15270 [Asparagus officinalis]
MPERNGRPRMLMGILARTKGFWSSRNLREAFMISDELGSGELGLELGMVTYAASGGGDGGEQSSVGMVTTRAEQTGREA